MKLLHPENQTYYVGDENRAELFLEIQPPKTKEALEFYKKMIAFWVEHIEEEFNKRCLVPEESGGGK